MSASIAPKTKDQRVERVQQTEFEGKLKAAYLGLATENRCIAEEFRFVDSEHLGKWSERRYGN